jgi:hypothetical protein
MCAADQLFCKCTLIKLWKSLPKGMLMELETLVGAFFVLG